MSAEYPRALDTNILSPEVERLQSFLLSKIIGQDRAVKAFVRVYQQIQVGLNKTSRPAGVFLFTGPTGVGKTELVRAAAECLLGSKDAVTRIDCGEYQHSHEVSKLIGSPPGYVGFGDKGNVRLSQDKLDHFQTKENKINFLLFDEIEEAHDTLFSAILQILDAGVLTLGNGDTTKFDKTIVIMTSNLGEKDAQKVMMGAKLGLTPVAPNAEVTDEQVYRASKAAATKHFKAKFINRVDRIIVFRSLSEESLKRILKLEINDLKLRIWGIARRKWEVNRDESLPGSFRPYLQLTKAAEEFLIAEGTSKIYGARELNRAVDRFMAFPLGSLIGSKQIQHGDVVEVDHEEGKKELTFRIIGRKDMEPLPKYDGTPQPVVPSPKTPPPDHNAIPIPPKEPIESGEAGDARIKKLKEAIQKYKESVPLSEPTRVPPRRPWKW